MADATMVLPTPVSVAVTNSPRRLPHEASGVSALRDLFEGRLIRVRLLHRVMLRGRFESRLARRHRELLSRPAEFGWGVGRHRGQPQARGAARHSRRADRLGKHASLQCPFANVHRQSPYEVAPYQFDPPVSPHLAAELADVTVRPERILAAASRAAAHSDALIVEGVGGLMVPLSPSYLVRDLAVDLGLPLVIVARPGLGTINHTLLSLEAARAAGLEIAAVVLTPWPEEPDEIERSNLETIASLGRTPVHTLGELYTGPPISSVGDLPLEDWLGQRPAYSPAA